MKRHVLGVAAAALGTMLIGGVVVQTASAADPVPTTVTLPLFGAPLTIGITTGPGGALTEVTVDPADGNVATQLKPRKVVFQSANLTDPTGDPAKVVVKSRHGGKSVSARAASLADVSGPGTWSSDVFGDGIASTVAFTVAAAADGSPDITGITTTGAAAVVGEVKHSSDDDDDDDDDDSSMSARVSVKFANAAGDQSRSVTVSVKVRADEDGSTSAKLSVSLGRLKGVAVDAALAAGPHTWSGVLCDNSAASITYDVAADGSVSNVIATPGTGEVRAEGSKIEVRFSHDERVRIRVREDEGQIKISVDERIRCDSPNPTTNVSSSIPADDEGDDHDGDHRGGDDHDRDGGGGHDDDDDTSTTDVTTTTSA